MSSSDIVLKSSDGATVISLSGGLAGPQGIQGIQGPQGVEGPNGPAGATGAKGDKGDTGATGAAATVAVGSTNTGSPGTGASVSNSGSSSAAVLEFTIPQGVTGATGPAGPAGPSTPDADATTKGKVKLASDLSGTADAPKVNTRTADRTVGLANADHIISGVNDHLIVQAAHDALPATGGTIYLRATELHFSAPVVITKPNVTIAGKGKGATVVYADADFSTVIPESGLFAITGGNPAISNVTIQDMSFDEQSKANVQGITLNPTTANPGVLSIYGVRIIRCSFTNLATSDVGHVSIYTGGVRYGGPSVNYNLGTVENVLLYDCEFLDSTKYQVYVHGSFLKQFKIDYCRFKNSNAGCIAFLTHTFTTTPYGSYRANQDWEITRCTFKNNMLTSVSGQGYIHDSNRAGVRSFKIHHNFFDGYATTAQQFCINVHASIGLEITHNIFWKTRTLFAIGASANGDNFKIIPDVMPLIAHNFGYQFYNFADHDSSIFAIFDHNRWYEPQFGGLQTFSDHFPTKVHGDFMYNPAANAGGSPAAVQLAGYVAEQGAEIKDVTVIDDRLLTDPTTAPVLTQVAGGSLGARTYFVKYSFVNDTGETLASAESTLAVSANNLLKATFPYTSTYGVPRGAKKVNWYVGVSTGAETLQDYTLTAWQQEIETDHAVISVAAWTEPTTGLIAGSALPGSNTTHAIVLAGIYEISGGDPTVRPPAVYEGNHFYGIATPVSKQSTYLRILRNNYTNPTLTATGEQSVELMPYAQGNITGATTFDVNNGEVIEATLIGNVTATIPNGHWVGEPLRLRLTQDATGGRTMTWPGNVVLGRGGSLVLSTTPSVTDRIRLEWDGTNWIEQSRTLSRPISVVEGGTGSSTGASAKRVVATASSATPTPNIDVTDIYELTALAADAVFGAPTGTPTDGQVLIVRIKDNGTGRLLSFNAAYRFSSDQPAPTTTTPSKTMYLGFVYNSADSKYDNLAQRDNV